MSEAVDKKFLEDLGCPGLNTVADLKTLLMGLSPSSFEEDDREATANILHELGWEKPSRRKRKRRKSNSTIEKENHIFRNLEILTGHDGPRNRMELLSRSLCALQSYHLSCLEGLYLNTNDILGLYALASSVHEKAANRLFMIHAMDRDRVLEKVLPEIITKVSCTPVVDALGQIKGWTANAHRFDSPGERHDRLNQCAHAIGEYLGTESEPRHSSFVRLEAHLRRCYLAIDKTHYIPAETLRPLYDRGAASPPIRMLPFLKASASDKTRLVRMWFDDIRSRQIIFPRDALQGKQLTADRKDLIQTILRQWQTPVSQEEVKRLAAALRPLIRRNRVSQGS